MRTESQINSTYNNKAKSSFETKFNLYKYALARIGKSSISENSFSRFNLEEETILRKAKTHLT